MPMTLFLNHPISHSIKVSGEGKDCLLDKFTCQELRFGDRAPDDDIVFAVMRSTRTESGEVPAEADLRKLDLAAGISAAVHGVFDI
jgi:hypothetical protein